MRICCCSFDTLVNRIVDNKMSIIMFGAGAIGQVTVPEILNRYQVLDKVDCYLDNNETMWGKEITASGRKFLVKSPEYLKDCSNQTLIFLNISRFPDVIEQLQGMACTENMDCYIMPMMLIHNYCSSVSEGRAILSELPIIPKKIHYMWLGRKPLPDNLKKCIDSWYKYCPEYEIIEWNEDNYDIDKHSYMRQAYDQGAYGFVPDYARLDILYNEGGIYLDTDVEIKKNIDDLLYQEAFCGVEKWQIINYGGMSGAVKGHPMIKKFLDARQEIYFLDENGKQNKNTCGFYDTRVALQNGYIINGKTQNINGMNIYAYDYFQPFDYMSGIKNETENTYSIHWFYGGWMDEKMKEANAKASTDYKRLYEIALKND